ncbi:MAG: FHA domain-containing protein [Alphaproteobacteria bacterium]|nr:FHA domain-containing protein [Alphaproteobacteria bacterium]MDE2335924.1 FHA domain-containing protein [Alphaproteobacteria bacterium]
MKLVLEVRNHDDDTRHFAFSAFPVHIGRAFNNDVIVGDPYVSPHHLRLDCDGETCTAADMGSENGFSLNGQPKSGSAPVKSGDALRIGQTEIVVYAPGHPVAATLPLAKDHPIFAWAARPLNVWACFLLALAVTLGWAWLEIWSDEESLALAAAVAATAGIIVLWSTLWSVGGRLTRHKAHFKSHIALICLYMIAGTAAWYVEAYTDFLSNGDWLSQSVTYGLNFILLSLLLNGSLALASKMRRRRRAAAAMLLSLGVTAGVFIFTTASTKSFNQQPVYSATLEPYLSGLAPTESVSGFMADNDRLFADRTFAHSTSPHDADLRLRPPVIPFQHPQRK